MGLLYDKDYPISNITSNNTFAWPNELRSNIPLPSTTTNNPTKAITSDPPFQYAQANNHYLIEDSSSFLRGGCWMKDVYRDSFESERSRLMCLGNQPELRAAKIIDKNVPGGVRYELKKEIPGQILMELGMPFYQCKEGDQTMGQVVGLTHTPESFRHLYGNSEVGETGAKSLEKVFRLMIGDAGEEPWWKNPSLRQNDRSKMNEKVGSCEGSYSLAVTLQEGEGAGVIVPVTQSMLPSVRKKLSEVIDALGDVNVSMRKTAMTQEDYLVAEAEMVVNNVIQPGHGSTSFTSLQLNIHLSDKELDTTIGIAQGTYHIDDGDDPVHRTVGVIVTQIPPGV